MFSSSKKRVPVKLILPFHTLDSLRVRIGWIINIRWIIIFGLLAALPISKQILNFQIAYSQLYIVAAVLIGMNLIYFFLFRYYPFKDFQQEFAFTEIQQVTDLVIISFLVHYIGGIENPFFFLYIVNIIISGVLFLGKVPYVNAIIAAILLTTWSILEYNGTVSSYSIRDEVFSLSYLVTSLGAFYVLIFATTYVIRDFITGYRHLKSVIDEKSEQLENTIRERDEIFRFTAHELKSPLTTLRSMLAVIEEVYSQKLDKKVAEMIEKAVVRTDQVLSMVKDMIDVTHYRHGLGESVIESVNLNHWIIKTISPLLITAERKQIEINVIQNSPDVDVNIDSRALEKVLLNLVTNAIRYSYENTTITITPFYKRAIFGFSVADQGIGISEKDIGKIFDEFYRSKNARELERLGTGLGLSLIKQIVEQFNGKVFVESELGKGSCFTIEMPIIKLENS